MSLTTTDRMPPSAAHPVTAANTRWIGPSPVPMEAHGLAAALEQPLWLAQILLSRDIATPADARRFLLPNMAHLHDPFLLHGMREAVDRIWRAIAEREPMLIYGDYDVDGTTATVLLKTAIDRVTAQSSASLVRHHIPHRIREGYGMQSSVLEDAAAAGVRLVISVDTGIRAFAAAAECRRLGLDLIVTDHHLPDGVAGTPDALAIINPNQSACCYPYKDLCGAAVAFKLAHALLQTAGAKFVDPARHRAVEPSSLWEKLLPSLLKLVAIATVADAVPLTGENRTIVALGLRELREARQPGLRALMELAEVTTDAERGPSATDVAFRIAPRINAAGRMDVAEDVVRMLLTRDAAEGRALAAKLHHLNGERRSVEAAVLNVLEQQLEVLQRNPSALEAAGCIVLDGEGWHRGVIGILASRVVERTGRPALVIAHEDGSAHGSGRSIAGFHLLDAITAAHTDAQPALFERFGGHAHAVGFSLASEHVPLLRARLSGYAAKRLPAEALIQRLTIDAEINLEELSTTLVQALRLLEPFGHGNREPLFVTQGLQVVEQPLVLKGKHLKLHLQSPAGKRTEALCWSRSVQWPQRLQELGVTKDSYVDVVYRVRQNQHAQYGGTVEMEVCDLRPAMTLEHV